MTQRELFERSLAELHAQLEKHQELMQAAFDGGCLDKQCVWNGCQHQHALVSVLVETVQVLEETRKAFKSKQLEQLRNRLMKVLADQATNQAAAGKALHS